MSVYPWKEIEARQRELWSQSPPPAPEPGAAGQTQKHFVLLLPAPLGPGAASFSELRRFVVGDVHARLHRLQRGPVRFGASWDGCALAGANPAGREEAASLLHRLAISIDGDAEADLHRPEWYRWTQWVFIQLLRRGLVSRRPLRAVPAIVPDRLVPDRLPDRIGEKPRVPAVSGKGWFFDISSFGDRLLNDLDRANWPLGDKKEQRYRLGRRRGCEVVFQVSHAFQMEFEELPVFTTQVESIYGATFILIHPDHPLLPAVLDPSYEEDVNRYRERLLKGSESLISGARTGGYALNPANLKRIPVLVSALAMDPFLGGAVMGVPGHDPEQFELARRLYLPIREAIRGPGAKYDSKGALREPFTGEGTLTNSSIFSGLPVRVARERIIANLGRKGICSRVTRFRLQWVPLSGPGLWGVPVPVVHCSRCGEVVVPEEALPVVPPRDLPAAGAAPASKGVSPAGARAAESHDLRAFPGFLRTSCPLCSGPAERDPHLIAPWLGQTLAFLRNAAGKEIEARGAVEGGGPVATPGVEAGTGGSELPGDAGSAALPRAPAGKAVVEGGIDFLSQPPPFPEGEESGPPGDAPERAAPGVEVLPEDRELFPDEPAREHRGGRSARGGAEEEVRPVPPRDPGENGSRSPSESAARDVEEDGAGAEDDDDEDDDEAKLPQVFESRFHPFRSEGSRRWLPADAAFGRPDQGAHFLLLLRAVTRFLNDIGEIEFQEPLYRYLRFGPVEAPASPPVAIESHGADALRVALLGLGPAQRPARIDLPDLRGARRFLDRVWRQVTLRAEKGKFVSRAVLEAKHRLIHNVTQRLRRFKFHTALASLHEFLNFLESPGTSPEEMDRSALCTFLVVLSPFAPHLAAELWSRLGETASIASVEWPEAKMELLKSQESEIPVRIDGRIRARLKVAAGLERERLEAQTLRDEKVQAALAGRPAARVIAVVDRLVNILTEVKTPEARPDARPDARPNARMSAGMADGRTVDAKPAEPPGAPAPAPKGLPSG